MIYERAIELAEALESGKYIQLNGQLRGTTNNPLHDSAYCCLGVACDISGKGSWVDEMSYKDASGVKEESGNFLTGEVMAHFGFSDVRGCRKDGRDMVFEAEDGREAVFESLVGANDSGFVSFKAIAKVIRGHWEFL